jgi:outer membrane receptor for ferrienterochelin and colicins
MKIKIFILIISFTLLSGLTQRASAQIDSISNLSRLSLAELMNIKVITASGFLQKTSDAPANIQVISARQILERGYEELSDALQDIPGIDMIHLNGYAPTLIYFRGMYGAENLRALLMIDGIVENNIIGSNDMAGPAYNLHNVERIEIIWGPASVLYGANAFGGVINIITRKGGDINGVVATKGFGSFNTSLDKVYMGAASSKFEVALSGSLYSTDGPIFSNRDPNYSASYVDKAYSLSGSVSHLGKTSHTTLGFRAYKTPMGWGTFFNSPTEFLGLPAQGYENKGVLGLLSRNVRNERSGLASPYSRTLYVQNEFKPSNKLSFLTRGVYRETGIGEDSYAYITIDGKTLYRVITANHSTRTFGEFIGNFAPSDNHKFSAGIQWYRDNIEKGDRKSTVDTNTLYLIDGKHTVSNLYSTFLPREYDIRHNFGSYLQYAYSSDFLRKTTITLGGRYDYNNYYGSNVSPRLAIINQPTDNFTVKLQFGTAYRAPTNNEIYQAPPNTFLREEKIKTYELNLAYEQSGQMSLRLNGFRNQLKDVIVIGNLSNLTVNKNPGEITINGIEGQFDYIYSSRLSGFANFTLQDASGQNKTTKRVGKVPGIARVKGNIGLSLNVQDLFNASLTGNWVGDRRAPSTSPYGAVDGYFLTHLNFRTKKLFNERVTASLHVRNLFDLEWLDPGFRTADGFLFSTVLEQPGRSTMLKIEVSL